MMSRCTRLAAFFLGLALMWPAEAGEYVARDVVGAGGGAATGAGYQLLHTVGQPVVNVVTGSDYIHEQGFWYLPWFYVTGEEAGYLPPMAYRLDQNYPNPFNPSTNFSFTLARPSEVTLRIYDVSGRLVSTVLEGRMEAGRYSIPFDAGDMASGVYFYRLKAADFERTRKMVVLR
jgi:hypothetical protein